MKEVCLDARMLGPFGIGTYLKNLIQHLSKAPIKLRLIAYPESCKDFDIIPAKAPIYSLEEQIELPRLIPQCDLFWSPHYNVPISTIKAKKRLVTIHDVCHLAFPFPLLKRLYAKAMLGRAVSLSDRIITDSYFSRDEILKYTKASKDKISVIYNGVDPSYFSESLGPKENFVLFVGNGKPHKNLHGLIQALEILKDKNLKLVAVTDGNVSEERLRELYQKARLLIMPSFYEGFGLPALEAMSCGCPVVAARAASLPEVCGEAVEYVDPANPEDIARGISAALNDELALREKGRLRCQAFKWEEAALKTLRLIEEII